MLPRGGSCATLPVGYMIGGENGAGGKDGGGGVQTTEMMDTTALPKSYTIAANSTTNILSAAADQSNHSTLARPRLNTPIVGHDVMNVAGVGKPFSTSCATATATNNAGGWGLVQLWRKMLGGGGGGTNQRLSMDQQQRHRKYDLDEPYCVMPSSSISDAGSISAVYAELNSLVSGGGGGPMTTSAIYSLNTYSEIRDSPAHHLQHHHPMAHHLHLRRLLNGDGTYENAAYTHHQQQQQQQMDNGSNCSVSTPSSAYYSDLSNSDGRCSHLHHHQLMPWTTSNRPAQQQPVIAHRLRVGSEASSMYGGSQQQQQCLCCQRLQARDLMPVALQVIPDNQQMPPNTIHHHHHEHEHSNISDGVVVNGSSFCRGGVSASLEPYHNCVIKRPLPPLPSRQQQRPQRRYAYAIGGDRSSMSSSGGGAESPSTLSCVPSEYV